MQNNWAHHLEFLILLLTILGSFYTLDCKIERQSERSDRLYEMFIDLVKENKKSQCTNTM